VAHVPTAMAYSAHPTAPPPHAVYVFVVIVSEILTIYCQFFKINQCLNGISRGGQTAIPIAADGIMFTQF